MYPIVRTTRFGAALFSVALLAACGDDQTAADHGDFCDAMEQASSLLEPNTGSPTPVGTRARYEELSSVLDVAEREAPTTIAGDVATFATAIDNYVTALASVDYDLDGLYSTPEGVQLADDTSHAITPAMVEHLTGPCDISLG